MAGSSWEEFFAAHLPPTDFEDNRSLLKEFSDRHNHYGNKIVLVTSGGTTVPLEHNTVRFVDNFSAGKRGAASAEYFLEQGYAVIFMYRQKSLEPFTRHFNGQKLLDMLDIQERGPNTSITVAAALDGSCWYVDSGALLHMCNNKNWMYGVSQSTINNIKVADNKTVAVKGSGKVDFQIRDSDGIIRTIQVRDVLYVPTLTVNLLSVSQTVNNGCEVKFERDNCQINHLAMNTNKKLQIK